MFRKSIDRSLRCRELRRRRKEGCGERTGCILVVEDRMSAVGFVEQLLQRAGQPTAFILR